MKGPMSNTRDKATKIIVGIVIGALVVGAVYMVLRNPQQSALVGPIKIGAMFDLTAEAADWGEDELRAVKLAVDETNSSGGSQWQTDSTHC